MTMNLTMSKTMAKTLSLFHVKRQKRKKISLTLRFLKSLREIIRQDTSKRISKKLNRHLRKRCLLIKLRLMTL